MKFMAQRFLLNALKQARPQNPMHFDGRANNPLANLVLVHGSPSAQLCVLRDSAFKLPQRGAAQSCSGEVALHSSLYTGSSQPVR